MKERQSNKEKLILDKAITWIQGNWAWSAPLIFIYVNIVGVTQSWFQFDAFDINVFEFSELNDFLLAAFREPMSFLIVIAVTIVGIVFLNFFWLTKRIFPKQQQTKLDFFLKWLIYFVSLLYILGAPIQGPRIYNNSYNSKWKQEFVSNQTRHFDIRLKDTEKYGFEKGWIGNITLIGTTEKFVFFYDRSKQETLITLQNNILLMRRTKVLKEVIPQADSTKTKPIPINQ